MLGQLTKDNIGCTAIIGGHEHRPLFPPTGEDFKKFGGTSTNDNQLQQVMASSAHHQSGFG